MLILILTHDWIIHILRISFLNTGRIWLNNDLYYSLFLNTQLYIYFSKDVRIIRIFVYILKRSVCI